MRAVAKVTEDEQTDPGCFRRVHHVFLLRDCRHADGRHDGIMATESSGQRRHGVVRARYWDAVRKGGGRVWPGDDGYVEAGDDERRGD